MSKHPTDLISVIKDIAKGEHNMRRLTFIEGFQKSIPSEVINGAAELSAGRNDTERLETVKTLIQKAFLLAWMVDDVETEDLLFTLATLIHDTSLESMISASDPVTKFRKPTRTVTALQGVGFE